MIILQIIFKLSVRSMDEFYKKKFYIFYKIYEG